MGKFYLLELVSAIRYLRFLGHDYENCCHLGYDAMKYDKSSPSIALRIYEQ
jgi:hypothetical protein